MNKFFFLSVLLVLLLLSCKNDKNDYEGSLIDRDTFIVILAELQISDALMAHYALNQQPPPANQGLLYLSILNKHNTDRESFRKTMTYYSQELKEFDALYKDVKDYIDEQQSSYAAPDSVKK